MMSFPRRDLAKDQLHFHPTLGRLTAVGEISPYHSSTHPRLHLLDTMSWFIRKSPFRRDEDLVQHLVELLSQEAEKVGTPLTNSEKEALARESSRLEPLPEDLRQRTKELIRGIFEAEPWDSFDADPRSFTNSLEWADPSWPNIVALAEEVSSGNAGHAPPLHGWKRVKDSVQLVGCALLVVLLMFAVVITIGFLSARK
jgi:hypothetical protein